VSYFNISIVDINQCAKFDTPFGETHKCPVGTKVCQLSVLFDIECINMKSVFSVFFDLDKVLHWVPMNVVVRMQWKI